MDAGDDVLGKSLVYLTGDQTYEIPFEEKKFNLSPKAFTGEKQLLCLRKARPYEINIYRNLAENVNDQHGDVNCYPHASANVETRGEAVFAAKNAIDGVTVQSRLRKMAVCFLGDQSERRCRDKTGIWS